MRVPRKFFPDDISNHRRADDLIAAAGKPRLIVWRRDGIVVSALHLDLGHNFLQPFRDDVGVGRSLLGVLFQHLTNEIVQPRGEFRDEVPGAVELAELVFFEDFDGALPGERRPAGEHRVDDGAQRIEVAAATGPFSLSLLGRHVLGGPDDAARDGEPRSGKHLSNAKVAEFDGAIGRDQQVRGLQVAVNDSGVVGRLESCTDLQRHGDDFAPGEPSFLLQQFGQRLAVDVLHCVVICTVVGTVVVKLHDVGALELTEGLDFPLKTDDEAILAGHRCGKDFDRGQIAGLGVASQIDAPHAPGSQEAFQVVRPNAFGNHGAGRRE